MTIQEMLSNLADQDLTNANNLLRLINQHLDLMNQFILLQERVAELEKGQK